MAAMIGLRRVGRKLERGEDRAEEQPRAILARHQIGVLALPAKSGGLGQRLLHHGGGVDKDLHVATCLGDQPAGESFQPRLDDLVIIVALGIDRDRAAIAALEDRERIIVGAVIEAQHDDGAYLRPQRARIAAPLRGRFHPVHVAMGALGEEVLQPFRRLRNRVGPRHADDVEALLAGGARQRGLERRRVAQKSRSA